MADSGRRIVAVSRRSGYETEVDLALCPIFRTERAWSKREALGKPEWRGPIHRRVYRLAPDGWWFQERDISPHPDSGLPHDGPILTYAEVHPVSIAHQFILDRQPVPPALAEYIPQATEPAYFEWLKKHSDELSRARTRAPGFEIQQEANGDLPGISANAGENGPRPVRRPTNPGMLAPKNGRAANGHGDTAPSKARSRPARRVPRGRLDEQATIELTENPSLTYAQLAKMLKCNPTTLRDKRKCPLLASAKAKTKAQKREFYGKDKWNDPGAAADVVRGLGCSASRPMSAMSRWIRLRLTVSPERSRNAVIRRLP